MVKIVAYYRSLAMTVRYTFFFQAEDGIRDHCVTGVQTCALPIFRLARLERELGETRMTGPEGALVRGGHWSNFLVKYPEARSEERRVGKECRSLWSPYQ